jgi:hypothetical protein
VGNHDVRDVFVTGWVNHKDKATLYAAAGARELENRCSIRAGLCLDRATEAKGSREQSTRSDTHRISPLVLKCIAIVSATLQVFLTDLKISRLCKQPEVKDEEFHAREQNPALGLCYAVGSCYGGSSEQ